MPLRQAAEGTGNSVDLPVAPLDGSLVVIVQWGEGGSTPATPAGFDILMPLTEDPGGTEVAVTAFAREADGDDGTYAVALSSEWAVAEYTGVVDVLPIADAIDNGNGTTASAIVTPGEADPILVVGVFGMNNSYPTTLEPAAGWDMASQHFLPDNGKMMGQVFAEFADGLDTYEPATDNDFVSAWAFGAFVFLLAGGGPPPDPPVDPGYTPPAPGRAILEIYVHDEDATRWGTATWSADLVPTGTEGVWSSAGWQDVTPQGVRVHIIAGSDRPDRGILAVQEAAKWLVTTYDPDRVLDPGNPDSPYAPQLVSGMPIRVRSEASGRTVATAIVDTIRYRYKAPDYAGQITAAGSIASAHRADVPEDSILGDTFRERIRDAAIASGLSIGGIPLLGNDDAYPDVELSPRIEGPASLWEHIARAGQEILWVVYESNTGMLLARPWGGPLDRGREITYASLEDLEVASSEDGVYSVVRVADELGVMIERVAAPLPRYGRIVYERDETTIEPESWADAVLADRAWPGLRWIPGTVWAFTAPEVEYLSSLEIMERVSIVVPGVVTVSGRLLGMEIWIESRDAERARWLFLPKIATDGSTAIGTTTLVSDQAGDTLLSDQAGDYLEVG